MKTKTQKDKEKQQWAKLQLSHTAFKDSLVKLGNNWPQIRKEVQEAEKNKPPRDPITDLI